jgi:hypothetical protein
MAQLEQSNELLDRQPFYAQLSVMNDPESLRLMRATHIKETG